ncbi:MAG: Exopolyphosphatase [Alphaproteobacteria bacterium MarineAlpha4_Bin2]|nr:MAG: Exopolyphosphatase [Alphaproteobacteria bacterium MarineAlpha4_Bin2]
MAGHKHPHPNRRHLKEGHGRFIHTYGALDLGTHNCRLLVARPTRCSFRVIDAFSRAVRLGEGLERDGMLCAEAMERTFEALKVCASKIKYNRVNRIRCVATEACRQASNSFDFKARVLSELGVLIETISCEEEARLAMQGCSPLIDRRRPLGLMFDIGGGSTELIWLRTGDEWPELVDSISIPHGVVSLSERYGEEAISLRGTYEEIVEDMNERLKDFCRRHRIVDAVRNGDVQMLGASGTVTTLAGVCLNLPRYDRSMVDGATLEFDEVNLVSERLRRMAWEERARHPCIGRERAKLVVAGCAVLEAIMRQWSVGKIRVADRGVREGILLELMRDADAQCNGGN